MPTSELSARDQLLAIAAELELAIDFPDAVVREAEAHRASPGIDDPTLVDRTDIPFESIDGPSTKDLDEEDAKAQLDASWCGRNRARGRGPKDRARDPRPQRWRKEAGHLARSRLTAFAARQ